LGVPPEHVLDALVFSSPDARPKQVFVAGQPGAPGLWPGLARDFAHTMHGLWR
jgi:formimidoylglutamate deiminase